MKGYKIRGKESEKIFYQRDFFDSLIRSLSIIQSDMKLPPFVGTLPALTGYGVSSQFSP